MQFHQYQKVRQLSEEICYALQIENYVVQPVIDVTSPKWHLGNSIYSLKLLH